MLEDRKKASVTEHLSSKKNKKKSRFNPQYCKGKGVEYPENRKTSNDDALTELVE